MKKEAISHTKMVRLCRYLNIRTWQAVGLLETLWHTTGRQAPAGDIGKLSDEDIAISLDYVGDETAMVDALVRAGWVDRDEHHRLVIHDWADHCEDAVHAKLARMRGYFATGQAPKLTKLTGRERTEAEEFYSASGCRFAETAAESPKRQPDSAVLPKRQPTHARGTLPYPSLPFPTLPSPSMPNHEKPAAAAAVGAREEDEAFVELREHLSLLNPDDAAVWQLLRACRDQWEIITPGEIALLSKAKVDNWQQRNIRNPMGLLLRTVPEMVASYRENADGSARRLQ